MKLIPVMSGGFGKARRIQWIDCGITFDFFGISNKIYFQSLPSFLPSFFPVFLHPICPLTSDATSPPPFKHPTKHGTHLNLALCTVEASLVINISEVRNEFDEKYQYNENRFSAKYQSVRNISTHRFHRLPFPYCLAPVIFVIRLFHVFFSGMFCSQPY